MHPAPRHITEEELRVLEGCLHRWRSEVENDTCGTYSTSQTFGDNLLIQGVFFICIIFYIVE
jgi:hypothetical protein